MSRRLEMVKSGESFEEMVATCSISKIKCVVKTNYRFYSPRIYRGTECDVIVITESKIYCVECKNFSGFIMGDSLDIEWVFASSGRMGRVSNPVMSNNKHLRSIRGLIRKVNKELIDIENIVCVPDNCRIKSTCKEVMNLSSFMKLLERDSKLNRVNDLAKMSKLFDELKYREEV